ncbi:integrase family protein [mine drainage metagenome]|uniref:Integrase family protein n=1 Tax=mine drainage metagenome TaxID=410659 RepID=T1CLC8_9ZZZZ
MTRRPPPAPDLPTSDAAQAALPDAIARAAELWLARYGTHTRRRYALEWQRITLWVLATSRTRVCRETEASGFNWADPEYAQVVAYADFLSNPPKTWCGARWPRNDPRWRPFAAPLNRETIGQAMAALASFWGFALREGSAFRNPFALWRDRQPGSGQPGTGQTDTDHPGIGRPGTVGPIAHKPSRDALVANRARRALSEVELDALDQAIASLPARDEQDLFVRARARLIFDLGLLLGLRISEIASSRMSNLGRVRLGETTAWFWYGVGKGAKQAAIPAPDALLADLEHYRSILGCSPRPEPGEHTPLLRRTRTGDAGLSVRHVRQIFYDIAALAAAASTDREIRDALTVASPHWLRHTYVTRLIERNQGVVDLDTVHNARHGRIDTTLLYAHSDELRRYVAVKDLSWGSAAQSPRR